MGKYCFDEIDRLCVQAVEEHRLPAVAVAVGDRNGELYKKAWGHTRCFADDAPCFDAVPAAFMENAPLAGTNTLFDLASLTKMMSTAMVALKTIAAGQMNLGDPLSRYLDVPYDKRQISIWHLMTHTSGLNPAFLLEECAESPDTVAEAILARPLDYPTGTEVRYSCMGFVMLAKVLERIHGADLGTLSREIVFRPLGMTRTGYRPLDRGETDIAATEFRPELGKYLAGVVHDENARFQNGISGNAGLFSCLDDCITFGTMLANRGADFLPRRLFSLAVQDHTPGLGSARGLGFRCMRPDTDGNERFALGSYGHGGFTGTSLYVDAKTGLHVTVLTNRVHFTRACSASDPLRLAVSKAAIEACAAY